MKTKFSIDRLKTTFSLLLMLTTIAVFPFRLTGQQRNPVTVNVNIVPPYSVFLTDYISPGSNKLNVTLVFNDFNEPSWNVYLKIKIESNNVLIRTRGDFIPSTPITLTPGVPVQLTGDQLYPYFDYNNIDVSGMSKADLSSSGRLIEGNYTFCFEVYDYKKHTLISNQACAYANIKLNDPPRLVLPEDKSVIPLITQNINFQWQLPGANPVTTKYQLFLYELPDYNVEATVAVQNNQARIIFESAILDNPLFIYDINSPLLKRGKKYAWRVQATNVDKRDEFKNHGFSLVRCFYYGYPENGVISINSPTNGHAFSLRESNTFRWNAPDNLTQGQTYTYRLKVVEIQPDQTDSTAITSNQSIYDHQSGSLTPNDMDYEVTAQSRLFKSQHKYAWKVTAYTNDQLIASSPVYNCYGPPLIEAFYAGNHTVFVTNTTSTNISDLSGEGEVKISYDGKIQKVSFSHIRIEAVGALLIMKNGYVKGKCTDNKVPLKPEYAGNGSAYFESDSVLIDKDYMRLKGIVKWPFPLVTVKPADAFVMSTPAWVVYEDYVLIGTVSLQNSQVYDLADPYGFTLSLDPTSYIILRNNNNYCPYLNGSVTLPKNVKNPIGETVTLPFTASDRLDFVKQTSNPGSSSIELLKGTGINLYASSYVFDFSDSQSPGKLSGQPDWKGVYFIESFVDFPLSPDKSNQLFFKNPLHYAINESSSTIDTCWITTAGLQFNVTKTAEKADTIWFNTFPGVFTSYGFAIQNSILTKGYLKGNIIIPLLSEKDRFAFTMPLTTRGFATGYLDKSLDGLATVFNPDGGEQIINLKVNRAVFADNERLDMNIDLAWPLMNISMKSLSELKVWGNGNIGFYTANGTFPLASEIQTQIKGFEVTIDYLGCGRQEKYYSFGTSAKIVMAEDVAGPEGPPVVNIFSIAENSLLSGNALSLGLPDRFQNMLVQSGGKSVQGTNQTIGVTQTTNDSIKNAVVGEVVNNQVADMLGSIAPQGPTGIDTTALLPKIVKDSTTVDVEITIPKIIALIDKVLPFLKDEQRAKAEALKAKLQELDNSELASIYNELKDFDKFLKDLAKQLLKTAIAKINQPIINEANKIKGKITGFIDSKRDTLLGFIDEKIYLLVDSLANKAIRLAAPDAANGKESLIADIIASTAEATKTGVSNGINRSVTASIQKNITNKIIGIIDTAIVLKITAFVDSSLSSMGNAIIDKGLHANIKFDQIGENAKNLLPSIGQDLIHRVLSINVENTIKSTIVDAYKGIRWDSVGRYIAEQVLIGLAENKIIKQAEKAVVNAVTSVIGETGGEVAGALMKNVKLDFSNLGDKIKKGQFDKIIKFDPSYIKVKTNVADFEGWVKFTHDDPTWGDSWQATITAKIKTGMCFTASAQYINGSVASKKKAVSETAAKETFKYWFLELGVAGLNIPLTPMPITLDGAKGKVFYHMRRVSNGVYMPADSIKFGAGLQLFMFDTPSQGSIIAFDIGAEITILDGGFIFEMYGNAAIGNGNVVVAGVDFGKKSLIFATGYLGYNSIEKHFVATLNITFNTAPILCAGGEMGVDIKPGHWEIYVGKKATPIFVDLFCTKKPIFKGWFDANNNGIDMGLMVYIHIIAESPWLGFTGFKFKPWAEFKLDFGATAIIDFKPKFGIEEAHVWIDIYAGIGVKYDTFFSSGNLTIAAINMGGEVLFRTIPKTYIMGEMHGHVTVFNIGVGFSLKVEHTFS